MRAGLCAAVTLVAAACGRTAEPPASVTPDASNAGLRSAAPTTGWSVTEGIQTPESTYFDPVSGFIFSSQIAGQPTDRDGNGRIVKIAGDGTVVSTSWVSGLNAPKGLRACAGTLWTADIDEVIGVTIASGTIVSRVKIAGAQFLNDVACAGDGTVYVSDLMANRIYAVKDGRFLVFAEGKQLEYPNGLLVDGNRLIVGGWGKPEADFTTKVPGRLYALDLGTRAKSLITPRPFANIDGLESDGRGGYLVTDYLAGKLIRVAPGGESRLIRQFAAGAADLGFVPGARAVIIPHMNENTVAAYDISDALN